LTARTVNDLIVQTLMNHKITVTAHCERTRLETRVDIVKNYVDEFLRKIHKGPSVEMRLMV
jgi:hypothetical protein